MPENVRPIQLARAPIEVITLPRPLPERPSVDAMIEYRDKLEDLTARLPEMIQTVQNRINDATRSVYLNNVQLSSRQQEVLYWLRVHTIKGTLSNKEIAANMNITERTVKFHVSRLLAKFKGRNRGDLQI